MLKHNSIVAFNKYTLFNIHFINTSLLGCNIVLCVFIYVSFVLLQHRKTFTSFILFFKCSYEYNSLCKYSYLFTSVNFLAIS